MLLNFQDNILEWIPSESMYVSDFFSHFGDLMLGEFFDPDNLRGNLRTLLPITFEATVTEERNCYRSVCLMTSNRMLPKMTNFDLNDM